MIKDDDFFVLLVDRSNRLSDHLMKMQDTFSMISFCNNLTSYLVFWLSWRFDILQLFTIILDTSRSNLHSSWIYHSRTTMKVDETRNLRNELQFIYWISSSRVRVAFWIPIADERSSRYVALASSFRTSAEYSGRTGKYTTADREISDSQKEKGKTQCKMNWERKRWKKDDWLSREKMALHYRPVLVTPAHAVWTISHTLPYKLRWVILLMKRKIKIKRISSFQ